MKMECIWTNKCEVVVQVLDFRPNLREQRITKQNVWETKKSFVSRNFPFPVVRDFIGSKTNTGTLF